ncbi:MAG: CHAD domain-containing protein [Gammaproteobacteria bacterium]|nr:CHAD domain-containing protein [Gammaproteobacteria bacterium]
MKGSMFQRSLATQREFADLRERLRGAVRLDPLPVRSTSRSYFDTFDWRLYNKGLALEFDASATAKARLREIGAAAAFEEQALKSVPRFASGFPAGALRDQLDETLDERALLPLGSVNLRVTPYRASDAQGKILYFLEKEQILQKGAGRRGRTLATHVRVRTLRGYEKAGRQALSLLKKGKAVSKSPADPFGPCMSMLGRVPGEYSTRLRIRLSPEIGARAGISEVLLFLLDIMERNVPGVEEDLDSEFLHDFRIAARRSRSLISRTLGIFAGQEMARIKRDFSWLSQMSSGQRDLDVFLHDLPGYQTEPDMGRPEHLEPLRALLEEDRAGEHARLTAALRSRRFLGFVDDWRESLAGGAATSGAGMPLAIVANGSIRRQYRKLMKKAPEAGQYSEALHDLRKNGKQLRYLLEAFRSLYPSEDIEEVIAQLRRLQNVLGDIVDFHVQRTRLLGWRDRLLARPGTPADTIEAVDRLAQKFDAMEKQAADGFLACHARFAAAENTERIIRLFGEAA